jgi:uncharacterized BrkB/YihY/UPF0761 family membrane protein
MTFTDLLSHLLNFFAPAAAVGVALALLGRVVMRKRSLPRHLAAQAAINTIAGSITLVVGLVFFGNDGKMATYAALVGVCATSQWVLLRAWRN